MTLYGIDESRYQGTLDGQDFTIIRATAGNSYVDPTCDAKYQANKAAGKLLGVYHYAYPSLNDPISEAAWFVTNIQGYLGEAILVLDFETNPDVAWAKVFMDHVYSLTQVWPMIYMSASTVNSVDWSSVSGHDALWEAGYPSVFNVPNPPTPNASGSDMPYASGAWAFATIWQYTSSAGTLDKDVGYLTSDAWHKIAEGDRNAAVLTPPAPVVTPPPVQAPIVIPVQTPVVVNDPLPPAPVTPPILSPSPSSTPSLPTSKPPTPKPVVVTSHNEIFLEKLAYYQKGIVAFITVGMAWLATNSVIIPPQLQHWYQLVLGVLGAIGVIVVPNKPKS